MSSELGVIWQANGEKWAFKGVQGKFIQGQNPDHGFSTGDLVYSMGENELPVRCPPELVSREPLKFMFEADGDYFVSKENGFSCRQVLNPNNFDLSQGEAVLVANGVVIEKMAPPGAIPDLLPKMDIDATLTELKFNPEDIEENQCNFAGYDAEVRQCLRDAKRALDGASSFEKFGMTPSQGLILSGPSGTGKTTLARKIAREMQASLYIIRGPEVLSKWVGNSEELLRKIFDDASKHRSIIFFDEIDALTMKRTDNSQSHTQQLVAQLLTLMDGFSSGTKRFVIGTTNRPDSIDKAFLRPGRLDVPVSLGLPNLKDRIAILEAILGENSPSAFSAEAFARGLADWSGAEIYSVVRYAVSLAIDDGREDLWGSDLAAAADFVRQKRIITTKEVQS